MKPMKKRFKVDYFNGEGELQDTYEFDTAKEALDHAHENALSSYFRARVIETRERDVATITRTTVASID